MPITEKIKSYIRDVKDFPKEGIVFKDITPLFTNHNLVSEIVDAIFDQVKELKIDAIACVEARGFLLGPLLAQKLEIPFIPIRKKGKLPYQTVSHSYDLEYGTATIEMHVDAVKRGDNILIHDDLLATGGTAEAAAKLIKRQGAEVIGFSFLVELAFLNGKDLLQNYSPNCYSLVAY